MFKPKPPQNQQPQPPSRQRLPMVERPPRQEDIAALFTGAMRIKGCSFELPVKPSSGPSVWLVTCQFDTYSNETVWSMYEGEQGSVPLWNCPHSDLDLVFDMVCMSCGTATHTNIPAEVAPLPYTPPAPTPAPAPAPAYQPPVQQPAYPPAGSYPGQPQQAQPYATPYPPQPGYQTPPATPYSQPPASPPYNQPQPAPFNQQPAPPYSPPFQPQPTPGYQQPAPYPQPAPYGQPAPPPQPYQNPPQSPEWPGYQQNNQGGYYQQGQPYPPAPGGQQFPAQPQPQPVAQPAPVTPPPAPAPAPTQPPIFTPGQSTYSPSTSSNSDRGGAVTPEITNFIDLITKGTPNLLLGHLFVEAGIVPNRCLDAALKCQELVRLGRLNNEQAILALKRAAELGGILDEDIIAWAKDPDAARARSRAHSETSTGGHQAQQPSASQSSQPQWEHPPAANKQRPPQQQQPQQQPSQTGARSQQSAPGPGAYTQSPSNPAMQKVIELLKQAGLVSEADVETARKVRSKHGGELAQILVSAGKVSGQTLEAAQHCQELVTNGRLRIDRAISALHYCERMRATLKEAFDELQIELL